MNVTVTRKLGQFLTSIDIFTTYILPQIKNKLHDYVWVDFFAGEGNLILPMLNEIISHRRNDFFESHLRMFDKDPKMVQKCIENAQKYGISKEIAKKYIVVADTLLQRPTLAHEMYPIYHITNPPYLYIGNIQKTPEFHDNLKYFQQENEGYQDLYQIALINDLRLNNGNMIYIIPTNFIYGSSVSNKIRNDFLPYYTIGNCFIFEKKSFENTGTNVGVFTFKRRPNPVKEIVKFVATKINTAEKQVEYKLDPKVNYRAGNYYNEFIERYKRVYPLKMKFHLTLKMIHQHKGSVEVKVIDSNDFKKKNGYSNLSIFLKKDYADVIKNNMLWIRTIDSGSNECRVGLYRVNEFGEGIVGILAKKEYRTNPIQIFFLDNLSTEEQLYIQRYFNIIIEYLREQDSSDFMTTYKYSKCSYIRKYLGLYQVKNILSTYPLNIPSDVKAQLYHAIDSRDPINIIHILEISRNFNE